MRYMLIHASDQHPSQQWGDEHDAAFNAWLEEVDAAGVGLQGSRLRPASDATTIKIRGGQVIITDGPFAETKEQMAGYDLLECGSREEAERWAAKHPDSWLNEIEVRALPDSAPRTPLPEPADGKIQYLLLVCVDPSTPAAEYERMEPVDAWVEEMDGNGIRLYGSELESPERARRVRVRDQRPLVLDGPFAETKEQIAGFDVLECADLDEAIEVARKHPMARAGILEVRPLWPFEEKG
jgi:hypothetical protein